MHDCGKIGISEKLLNVTGTLTPDQYREIQRHPMLGFKMTCKIDYLRSASIIIRQHHERWDGKGYPDGLQGEEISLGARIVAIADSFDAMTSSRPYRRALDYHRAINELLTNRGTQFDPELVDLFVALLQQGRGLASVTEARPRLLLVGVEAETSGEIKKSVLQRCYDLLEAGNRETASRYFEFENVDMVICNRFLPDGDGIDFLIECKKNRSDAIRMMLVERQDVERMEEKVNRADLYAYVILPLRADEMEAMVENAFEWRRMVRDLHLTTL